MGIHFHASDRETALRGSPLFSVLPPMLTYQEPSMAGESDPLRLTGKNDTKNSF